MIGHLQGRVLFSDGQELILLTSTGVGYQIYYPAILPEGVLTSLFVSHVYKKDGPEEFYGFKTLRQKKLFELLVSVKGVGPKSAFSLMRALGDRQIIEAILFDNKKALAKAPGVGAKAAAQIILDLTGKIHRVKMYSESYEIEPSAQMEASFETVAIVHERKDVVATENNYSLVLEDALMACKELGFSEEKIIPLAHKIMGETIISKPEQLVHLVLKEL